MDTAVRYGAHPTHNQTGQLQGMAYNGMHISTAPGQSYLPADQGRFFQDRNMHNYSEMTAEDGTGHDKTNSERTIDDNTVLDMREGTDNSQDTTMDTKMTIDAQGKNTHNYSKMTMTEVGRGHDNINSPDEAGASSSMGGSPVVIEKSVSKAPRL